MAVVSDDELSDPLAVEDPAGAQAPPTPPTPPVVPHHSPSPAPLRQRVMAHLRPVSIPDLVFQILYSCLYSRSWEGSHT